jgi:hypothetical protein
MPDSSHWVTAAPPGPPPTRLSQIRSIIVMLGSRFLALSWLHISSQTEELVCPISLKNSIIGDIMVIFLSLINHPLPYIRESLPLFPTKGVTPGTSIVSGSAGGLFLM